LKIYKYIYNKKSKSQRLNPSQGKIKISPYSRFPIKEKRQNAEQVKILILACEGLTKRSAVAISNKRKKTERWASQNFNFGLWRVDQAKRGRLPGTGNVCCSGSENTSPGKGVFFCEAW